MTQHRQTIGPNEIKIQYREPLRPDGRGPSNPGQYAVDVPHYPPFTYTVDPATDRVQRVLNAPPGMQLLRQGALDSTMGLVNPYHSDTLTYVDPASNTRQFIPLSPEMNRAIKAVGTNPGSALRGVMGFDRIGSGDLNQAMSDVLLVRDNPNGSGKQFMAVDMDNYANNRDVPTPRPRGQGAGR